MVGDLHLDGSDPARERFGRLLEQALEWQFPLLILGDLFHYWFGRKHQQLPMFQPELELLRAAAAHGLSIRIIPGNRDFLLDDRFARDIGILVDGDELAVTVGEERIHFSHGDLFGTADVRYLRMRRVLRSRMVRFLANHLPVSVLQGFAARLRNHSERVVQQKSEATLEPDLGEVATLIDRGFHTVVCGHYHRQRDQVVESGEKAGRFMILDPFEDRGAVLVHDGSKWCQRRID